MNIRKGLSSILASGALALGIMSMTAAPAAADANFTLTNVEFDDGGTASGTFSFNVYGYLSGWNVTTTDVGAFTGNNYNPSINAQWTPGGTVLDLIRPDYIGYLHIVFTAPLGYADAQIDWAASYECFTYTCTAAENDANIRHFRQVSRDEQSPFAAVPEPGTLSLMGLGLLLVGSMAWLRRRKASDLV